MNTDSTQLYSSRMLSQSDDNMGLYGTGAIYHLEQQFSQLMGGHHYALAVCNATQALFATFLAFDIRDAEVIVSPYGWGGSLASFSILGNIPVFCDIDPATLTLNPHAIEQRITQDTRAILATEIYGNAAHASALRRIADHYGLVLMFDCAQSFGAVYNGKQSGSLGDAAIFSLSAPKPLCAGEGGMIVTPHESIFEELVIQTQHPYRQQRDVPHRISNEFALNLRMHPQAAQAAVTHFDSVLDAIRRYQEQMIRIDQILTQELCIPSIVNECTCPSFFRYTLPMSHADAGDAIQYVFDHYGIKARLTDPPIQRVLYGDPAWQAIDGHTADYPCPVAERQCTNRVWVQFDGAPHIHH